MKKTITVIGTGLFLFFLSEFAFALFILQFKNFVKVSPFADGENWFLVEDLDYEVRDTGKIVTVPAGFVTDFASIPRPFWSILPTWGKYGPPAVVHDFLYWDQRCTRDQADRILLVAMEESDVGFIRRFFIHRAVAWGGGFGWDENEDIREEGKTREIPNDMVPQDPTTSWKTFQDSRKASVQNDGHLRKSLLNTVRIRDYD
jgi:hypothetical protein